LSEQVPALMSRSTHCCHTVCFIHVAVFFHFHLFLYFAICVVKYIWFDLIWNLTGLCDIFCLLFLTDLRQIWILKSPRYSAATYLRCGGKWCMSFIGNFVLFPVVEEFWKSVEIWRRYRHEFGGTLFGTRCIYYVDGSWVCWCVLYVERNAAVRRVLGGNYYYSSVYSHWSHISTLVGPRTIITIHNHLAWHAPLTSSVSASHPLTAAPCCLVWVFCPALLTL